MDKKQFLNITSGFPEIKEHLYTLHLNKTQQSKIRRRLKTKRLEYSFLQNLVGVGADGEKIETVLKQYFKYFDLKIEKVGKKFDEEDLRLWINDRLLIFEVTGTARLTNKEEKIHQISKWINIRQTENPKLIVSGVFVTNHDNLKVYNNRNKKPFGKRQINFAQTNNYCLSTTVDFLKAFLQIKEGELSIDELINRLCIPGEFKI